MRLLRRLNRRYLLRYRLEYAVAAGLVYGVRALSPAFAWASSRALGRLLFHLGVRRKEMLANLAVAFPDLEAGEREALARKVMEHFASMVTDIIFQRRMLSRRNLFERIRFRGWAEDYMRRHGVEGLRRRARGILFTTAHLGNWEIASGLFGMLGVRIDPVFRHPQNPFLDRLLQRIRLQTQGHFIAKRGAVRAMLDRLEEGVNVGFLFDQEAVHGIYVPFFGLDACTHKTPAVLARDYGVRIFFGAVVRRGDFLRYELRGNEIDVDCRTEDREADLREILSRMMLRLEEEIRRFPEQYLWAHRRWKRTGIHGERHLPEKRK